MTKTYVFFSGIIVISFLCFGSISVSGQKTHKKDLKELDNLVHNSIIFNQHFSGLMIEDAVSGEILLKRDAEKHFTPASNVKLVTFYAALKVLGDSLNVWRVGEKEGHLVIQGTGNPMWRHPAFLSVEQPEPWKKSNLPVKLSFDNWKGNRFGSGWSWADFPYYYQVERSPIPIHGNYVQFKKDSLGKWLTSPGFWLDHLTFDATDKVKRPKIYRDEFENTFYANKVAFDTSFNLIVPFRTDVETVLDIFREDIQQPVSQLKLNAEELVSFKNYKVSIPDTLYRFFLQESDNFIGEQLLILCSDKQFGYLDPEKFIGYARDSLITDWPQKPVWVDGSGLSRYNLFSPMDMVFILKKLYAMMPQERLFNLLPAGGVSGTISESYKSQGKPFVFAKTGSLSNNHCLSGYVVTNKGKTLIFSFMNNHFVEGSSVVKKEMYKVLTFLRENF
jgi:D-alanyl-D-alanine carboxypeptidase/D-alanyl-D-alanine-endopeptidase (penicillin-binding protein 4)